MCLCPWLDCWRYCWSMLLCCLLIMLEGSGCELEGGVPRIGPGGPPSPPPRLPSPKSTKKNMALIKNSNIAISFASSLCQTKLVQYISWTESVFKDCFNITNRIARISKLPLFNCISLQKVFTISNHFIKFFLLIAYFIKVCTYFKFLGQRIVGKIQALIILSYKPKKYRLSL